MDEGEDEDEDEGKVGDMNKDEDKVEDLGCILSYAYI